MDYLQRSTALADMVPAAWREFAGQMAGRLRASPPQKPLEVLLSDGDVEVQIVNDAFWANDTGLPESFYLGGYLGHLLPQTQLGPLFDKIIKDDLVTVDFTAAGATALACLALDHGGAQPDAVRLAVEGDLADEPIPE